MFWSDCRTKFSRRKHCCCRLLQGTQHEQQVHIGICDGDNANDDHNRHDADDNDQIEQITCSN